MGRRWLSLFSSSPDARWEEGAVVLELEVEGVEFDVPVTAAVDSVLWRINLVPVGHFSSLEM